MDNHQAAGSPGSAASDSQRLATFQHERLHLLNVAFRILGSDSDAEDVVQEAWMKYNASDVSAVRNVPAWLTTVTTRLCVDVLRRRRDIPDTAAQWRAESDDEPEEAALLADELTAAFVVVLDELTPPQRVALVLHDAFGMPFDEIAHILGTSTAAAKKLASRARSRVRARSSVSVEDAAKARKVVEAFLHAAREGNTDRLIALLDPNVVRIADRHVLRRGAPQRLQGVHAVVSEACAYRANALRARIASVDGRPGIAIVAGPNVQWAMALRVVGERIVEFEVIADPQRLAHVDIRIDT